MAARTAGSKTGRSKVVRRSLVEGNNETKRMMGLRKRLKIETKEK
jgi:hypothetical protein